MVSIEAARRCTSQWPRWKQARRDGNGNAFDGLVCGRSARQSASTQQHLFFSIIQPCIAGWYATSSMEDHDDKAGLGSRGMEMEGGLLSNLTRDVLVICQRSLAIVPSPS